MIPVTFDGVNSTLNRPDSMTDEECGALPVELRYGELGINFTSCWELSEEELALIIKTKKVYLTVYGYGMPPVAMYV